MVSMTQGMRKTTFREIRSSLGRFLAIAAIIALGVGFFAGLKNTTEDMVAETDRYLSDLRFYDFRLACSLGFTDNELSLLRGAEEIKAAEGCYQADVIIRSFSEAETPSVLAVYSLTDSVNRVALVAGRMPETEDEIVLEARGYGEDVIGRDVVFSDMNSEETLGKFAKKTYRVVGTVNSPLYLNYERGTTALLDGSVDGYGYILPGAFCMPAYSSLYCVVNDGEAIYSKAYEKHMDSIRPEMEELLDGLCKSRTDNLQKEAEAKVRAEAEKRYALLQMPLPDDFDASEMVPEWECTSYLLDRETNIGYMCFDNDAHIVDGIARVFPVFFILVAALVVMTTMSRMVEEQRTQMGVLKALGYSAAMIAGKYVIYSGAAALSGCLIGFFAGCYVFPTVIWKVYGIMYGFTDELVYVWNGGLFAVSLAVSLFCSVGITLFSIGRELREVPAQLIRPRAPKNGKRILLERITFFWKRLPFLHMVSLRNVVRYRKRFFMMIIGIAGCTALLITGQGIRDSIVSVPATQYEKIEHYDYLIRIDEDKLAAETFCAETHGKSTLSELIVSYGTLNLETDKGNKAATYTVPRDEEEFAEFVTLSEENGKPVSFPGKGECVLSGKMAEQLGVSTGDVIQCHKENGRVFELKVSSVFRNYVGDKMYLSEESLEEGTGETAEYCYCFAKANDPDKVYETGAALLNTEGVVSVSVNREFRDRIEAMLQSLDYIVILVICCAAALAFIVLYNLTNINITERLREIATIKVLGFYSMETSMYVFRENFLLTAIGAAVGIPLGILLHRFVMSQIQVDLVAFNVHVSGKSFLLSIVYTFVFAVIVDLVMHRKLERINMAESMKSIE